MTEIAEVRQGLKEIRDLVDTTHWIKGSYVGIEYLDGDGVYTDGALVANSKVVGCLVGLSRLVGAKQPTLVKGKLQGLEVPLRSDLTIAMEDWLVETIRNEFISGYYEGDDEDDEQPELPEEVSIEGWNDWGERTRKEVLALVERTIERVEVVAREQ